MKYLSLLLSLSAIGLALVSVLGLGGDLFWAFDLFSHFRPHYAVLALLALPLALGLRQRGTALLYAAVVAGNGSLAVAYMVPGSVDQAQAGDDRGLAVATLNLFWKNQDAAAMADFLRRLDADVVALQEVTPFWAEELARLRDAYPYQRVRPGRFRGLALLSRRPWRDADISVDGGTGLGLAVARFDLAGQPVAVVGTHIMWPAPDRAHATLRRREAEVLLRALSRLDMPAAVLGDLNSSPWCTVFRRLRAAGLSTGGAGTPASWPSRLGWAGVPIDHVLVSDGLTVVDKRRGPDVGSDHRPIIATLRLRG